MVGVQVTLALAEPLPQLGQDLFNGRRAQFELPEVLHEVRLPPAVNASPLVTNEAKNPKVPMVGVVSAGCRSTTLFIFLAGYGSLMFRAVSAFAECSASGLAARSKRKITQLMLRLANRKGQPLPGGGFLNHPSACQRSFPTNQRRQQRARSCQR